VELELKPRSINGTKYSQNELYSFLKENYRNSNKQHKCKITWNEEDIESSPRNTEGGDIRIKIYLKDSNNQNWVEAMKELAEVFLPILNSY
jgi:hypothetical protein